MLLRLNDHVTTVHPHPDLQILVDGCDSQTGSREDPGKTCWQHIHTCTSLLSFWACSHMEMPSGGEVRCPEGPVKHRDDSTLPKATKTEESADPKEVNEVGKYLLFCSPILFSAFSCIAWIMTFNTTRGPLEMLTAEEIEWKGVRWSAARASSFFPVVAVQ